MDQPRTVESGPALVVALALGWLGATLWAAYRTIGTGPSDSAWALNQTAIVLPAVISAGLLAGAAVGVLAGQLVAGRTARAAGAAGNEPETAGTEPGVAGAEPGVAGAEPAGGRTAAFTAPVASLAAGGAAGLAIALLVGGLILLGYGSGRSPLALVIALGVAAVLGGLLGGVRPPAVIGAGLAGMLAWCAVGLLRGAFGARLLPIFGGRGTAEARYQATGLLLLAVSVVGGAAAGLVAYGYLRRRDHGLRWPGYLVAGAGAGLILLLAEAVTRFGGGPVLRLAAQASTADRTALEYRSTTSLETAMVVLFVGAITAVIAYGRRLPGPDGRRVGEPDLDRTGAGEPDPDRADLARDQAS